MIQKSSLQTLYTEELPSLSNFASYSTLRDSNCDMIGKILELQAHLYKVHMEGQDLRLRRTQLQKQFQNRKALLHETFSCASRRTGLSSCDVKQRKQSQSTLQREKITQSRIVAPMQKKRKMKIELNSPNRSLFQSTTQRQTNNISSNRPIRNSVQEQKTETCNTTKMSNLSSARSIGIKKNIPSKHCQGASNPGITSNDASMELSNFKSIEQIWNGSKRTESGLHKISAKGTIKRKSYIT